MKRFLLFFLPLALAAPAAAQAPEPIKLALPPAAEPVPALKYLLLPELSEQTPGNAALLYYRAFSPEWWSNFSKREVMEKIEKAPHAPISDLKNSDLKWLLNSQMLREVDRAARREYCDWELAQRQREQGIYLPIPDVQGMRKFALLLSVRARLEMAQGQLDKALDTLKTGFALARHVSEGPSLIQSLVGTAIGSVMTEQLEELLRQPGAPNLYWALTDLPRPFNELRKPLQGEKLWLPATFPELRDLDNPHLSQQQRERLQVIAEDFVSDRFEFEGGIPPRIPDRLATIAQVAKAYPDAKRALIASGRNAEVVEAMPAVQVVMIESVREYERFRDDLFKWMALPYAEARPGLLRVDKQLRELRARHTGIPIAAAMLPAVLKVHSATTRLDRRIAALRCIEAIRLYTAAHDGKLPATLDDVKDVPIPTDPMTGKGFHYQMSGATATLTAGAPGGETANANNTLIYELTLRK